MKLHEAIAELQNNPEQWIRPVGWKFSGRAYKMRDGMTALVRSTTHDYSAYGMTAHPIDLMDDWELVDPKDVISGR